MGACSIVVYANGKSMDDAFRRAQEEAKEEHGSDIYNGEINNCELGRDVTFKKKDFDETDHFHEWILNNTSKRLVYGYCTKDPIVNKNKTKTTVESFPQKGTRKFETRYVAVPKWGHNMRIHISEKTQTEAVKKARAYVEAHPDVVIDILVKKVLISGVGITSTIQYKKASNEREGSYVFVGFAPC